MAIPLPCSVLSNAFTLSRPSTIAYIGRSAVVSSRASTSRAHCSRDGALQDGELIGFLQFLICAATHKAIAPALASSESLALVPVARFSIAAYRPPLLAQTPPETPASVFYPATAGILAFCSSCAMALPGRSPGHAARYQARSAASKELNFKHNGPTTGCLRCSRN